MHHQNAVGHCQDFFDFRRDHDYTGAVRRQPVDQTVDLRFCADVDASRITLRYNGTVVLDRGEALGAEPDVSGPSCTIELDLGLGTGAAGYLTSDLSYDYVRINADYRT